MVLAYEREMPGLHRRYPASACPPRRCLSIYMDQRCSSSRMNCTGELDATLSGAAQAWSAERPSIATPATVGNTFHAPARDDASDTDVENV